MIVKTWNNGKYNNSGAGYGIRISKPDRGKFFNKSWKYIKIDCGNSKNSQQILITDTFWTTCLELRSEMIGKYLIDNGLGIWERGKPHRLLLLPQDNNKFILMLSNPREVTTWAEGSTFTYDGCVDIGTRIYFGKSGVIEVSKQQYQSLLKEYAGVTIDIGTSRDKASTQSLGYWLQKYITKTAIASYVGKILLLEGYAQRVEKSMIKIM